MFRRMAIAADAAPLVSFRPRADSDRFAIQQPHIAVGNARHQVGVVAGTGFDFFNGVGIRQAMRCKKQRCAFAAEPGGRLCADASHVVVRCAHPQPARIGSRRPALAQPVRQANVVWMHVGADHPQDGHAFKLRGKNGFPLRF